MGNAGSSSATQRHKSASQDLSSTPNSPFREIGVVGAGAGGGAQAFTFDKKQDISTSSVLHGGSSQEDEDTSPYYTKPVGGGDGTNITHSNDTNDEFNLPARKRSSTVSEGSAAVTLRSNISTKADNSDVENKEDNNNEDNDTDDQCPDNMEEEQLKNPALPTVLRWDGGGKNVMISGTFSKWKPIPMVRSHGNFVTIIDLPEGDHQYKFCVDGEWKYDPKVKSVETDEGNKNNLVSVRQSDFEVFQALAKDSETAINHAEKEYSQQVPQVKPWEKVSGPPVLPPHLLQVILNKDTPLSCEPTLLPEPNHVMLNHLYALSIKDGVMVLSATHRYRKKYVTTLLYKPI